MLGFSPASVVTVTAGSSVSGDADTCAFAPLANNDVRVQKNVALIIRRVNSRSMMPPVD